MSAPYWAARGGRVVASLTAEQAEQIASQVKFLGGAGERFCSDLMDAAEEVRKTEAAEAAGKRHNEEGGGASSGGGRMSAGTGTGIGFKLGKESGYGEGLARAGEICRDRAEASAAAADPNSPAYSYTARILVDELRNLASRIMEEG